MQIITRDQYMVVDLLQQSFYPSFSETEKRRVRYMKGGKNKNSGLVSDRETPPPSDAVAGNNDVNSEKPLEVEDQERDRGADKEEKNGGDEEDVGIQEGDAEVELADTEKPKLAEGFYEIETVRRKRIRKGKIQYLIKWRGWPETANTWEPVENLVTCYDVIDAFEESMLSGKQRSTRKRKRTHALTHSQIKRKQQQQKQQHSPVDATYNVPAVKVKIIEKSVPSPPLASLNVIDNVDRNGSGFINIEVDEVANDNDLMLDSSVNDIEEQNELYLKLTELKGVMATEEASMENGVKATKNISVENGMIATKDISVEKGVIVAKETSVEKGVKATKETSAEKRVRETKETSVDEGVMAKRETSVDKRLMATRENFVGKGVMATREISAEKGVMATRETSVSKGAMETRETSVEKGVMATRETSVGKGVMETRETSAEKGVMATRETSVGKGVMDTRVTSVEKGVMATRETSVGKGVKATRETSVEKGMMATRETSVEKVVIATRETSLDKGLMATTETSVGRSENGITSGFSTANGTESLQSGRQAGAKRRKSTSIRRFKQQATSGLVKDPHDAVANATNGHLVAFMREEIYDHGLVGSASGCNSKCDEFKDTYAITEIIKAMSYSAPNDLMDVSVTFLAKRSDGKEVMVDNKFMKTNNPLMLISYYEKHLRHHLPQSYGEGGTGLARPVSM